MGLALNSQKPYIKLTIYKFSAKPTLGLDGTMLRLTKEMIDSLPDLDDERKEELYEVADDIDSVVDTRLRLVDYYLSNTFSGESIAEMAVLEALSDGNPKSWTELKQSVNVSTATLSKKLKALAKQGVVKRKVIPAFPPKTVYELDLRKDPEFRRYFLALGDLLKTKRTLISRLVWFAVISELLEPFVESSPPKKGGLWGTVRIYEQVVGQLILTLTQELEAHIIPPLTEYHHSWIPFLTTSVSISIMQWFWAAQVALFSPQTRAKEASVLLQERCKAEKARIDEEMLGEEILKKVIPKLGAISMEKLQTLIQQQDPGYLPKSPKIFNYES